MGNTKPMEFQPSGLIESLLTPAASLFAWIVRRRGDFYERGVLPSIQVDVPVVSVGNLTVGGTGKTPITAWLVGELRRQGLTCGIVSRGYGGLEKGPIRVTSTSLSESSSAETSRNAKRFGDEPSWLASVYPDVPVVIGGDRVADIRELLSQQKVQIIVADDAFQHRRLRRDLDIVVIDATEPRWHYRALPLGRMREGFDALSRAKFVLLSKTNQANEGQLNWLRSTLRNLQSRFSFQIIEFESSLSGFVPLSENRPSNPGEASPFGECRSGSRLVVLTAIGRPQVFRAMVEAQTGLEVAASFEFRDHHVFTPQDLADVEMKAANLEARAIVVTEKDATKLGGWSPKVSCYVSRLTSRPCAQFISEVQELYETIGRLTR